MNLITSLTNRAKRTVLDPLNNMVDEQITDVATTIGSFVIRYVRGKFQRSITFIIGSNPSNYWMEEALYGIIYTYNDIKSKPKLELYNQHAADGSTMHYRLDNGSHNLKYHDWDILLFIQTQHPQSSVGRIHEVREYTIICYDTSPEFVEMFEKEMLANRNAILKIRSSSSIVTVYKDLHEGDGYTYWEKMAVIPKRKLSTIYLPQEQKKLLVDTINAWFASKEFYHQHGIPWNLKILLHGDPGTGKSSIVKVIASEWNRNIYECTGGKNGRFIPNALTDHTDQVIAPLFSISDIDKYPSIVNEPNVDVVNQDGAKEDSLVQKQAFGNMLNALDGVMTGEGHIIVMTTNHIEKFSETFLRPGRVDLNMEIGAVTVETFRRYVYDFYGEVIPKDIKLSRKDITISEMQRDVVFMKMNIDDFVKKYTK